VDSNLWPVASPLPAHHHMIRKSPLATGHRFLYTGHRGLATSTPLGEVLARKA